MLTVAEITEFASMMAQEMEANSNKDKRNWRQEDPRNLAFECMYHQAKLVAAIKENNVNLVREHAADVANLALMTMIAFENPVKFKTGYSDSNPGYPDSNPYRDDDSNCGIS